MMNSSQQQLSSPPERDLKLLSAYLDNQLSVAERVALERRVAAEPALRAELEELRATAAALRALTPLRPPRSFTLDPATVARPRAFFPLTWVMQLGSGLAGFALVLLATVQMVTVGAVPASAPMAAQAAPTAAAFEAPYAAATEAPAAMMEAAPAPESARQTAPSAAPAAEGAAGIAEAAPTAAPAAGAAAEATPTADPAAADQAAGSTAMQAPADGVGGVGGGVGSAGAAGGAPGGPQANSPPAVDAIQSSGSSSPATTELPPTEAARGAPQGLPPGLTLALGVALIALAAVWRLASRSF